MPVAPKSFLPAFTGFIGMPYSYQTQSLIIDTKIIIQSSHPHTPSSSQQKKVQPWTMHAHVGRINMQVRETY